MKFYVKVLVISILFLLGTIMVIGGCKAGNQQENNTETPSITVNVDDFAADRQAYSGYIAMNGIVSSVNNQQSSFVIIDKREYIECGGDLTCADNYLTILVPTDKFSGLLPEIEDEVLVYINVGSASSNGTPEIQMVERNSEIILRRK